MALHAAAAIAGAMALACSPGAHAQAPRPAAAQGPAAADPAFSTPAARDIPSTQVLKAFLAERGQQSRPNAFCFVQQAVPAAPADAQGVRWVWMVWSTGAAIYRLRASEPGEDDPFADDPAQRGRALARGRSIQLATDVVATEADVGGSSFLVTRAWVDTLTTQCRLQGRAVRVAAFRAPRQ